MRISLRKKFYSPLHNWKLRKRLIVSFVALVLLPILIMSGFNVVITRESMTKQVEKSFSDSIFQISTRISHQFDGYNAALRFLALNRQIAGVFENTTGTYYQQYSDITYVYEPMRLMIMQLTPDLTAAGVYTENHHLTQRGDSVMYMERLVENPYYTEQPRKQFIQWFPQEDALVGVARMMKTSRLVPNSIVYVSLDSPKTFRMALENISAYGMRVMNGDKLIYAENNDIADLDVDTLAAGTQTIDNVRYSVVWQTIPSTGWRLCVYCPYSAFHINTGTTLTALRPPTKGMFSCESMPFAHE